MPTMSSMLRILALLPIALTACGQPAQAAPCGSPSTLIADARTDLPPAGRSVEIEAVVTADFGGADGFMGFFVQQDDSRRQYRAGVSEGLFVYAPRLSARAGDLMRLPGRIERKYGQTQLTLTGLPSVCATGRTVTAADLSLPVAGEREWIAREGMLVHLPQTLTVNDTHELGRYGSLLLGHGRLFIPTGAAPPGDGAAKVAAANALNRLVLDDGSSRQNPDSVPYPAPALSAANPVRAGDTVTGVRGVLEKRYGVWRLQPVPGAPAPAFAATNARSGAPSRHAGSDLRVASFNVLNYFNGNGQGGGFDAPGNRGAKNAAEFERQEAKLLAALHALHADVIGLMEVENNGYGPLSAVRRLAEKLGPDWRIVDPGAPRLGSDAIAVALIYNSRAVMQAGTPATFSIDDRSRQPLAATFRLAGDPGRPLTVVVNHFKSKNCADAAGADQDQGDGQGCWNPTRVRGAQALADWLANSPTGVPDAGTLIIGDLNSYAREDPIRLLAGRGYGDMLERFLGHHAYSYVYGGEAGYLDHVLADAAMAQRIRATNVWHINADEPSAFAYAQAYRTATQRQRYYAPDVYRSSDHDPVLVDVSLRDGAAGTGTPPVADSTGSGHPGVDGGGGAIDMQALLAILFATIMAHTLGCTHARPPSRYGSKLRPGVPETPRVSMPATIVAPAASPDRPCAGSDETPV